MVGAQNPFDLTYTNFIIRVSSFTETKDVFMVIASHITHWFTHVDISTGIETLSACRQRTNYLCRGCTTFEVDRFATTVSFGAIN